jgi:hypothetical protein
MEVLAPLLFDGAGRPVQDLVPLQDAVQTVAGDVAALQRSPIKRCKRITFGVRGRLDRTQEVAGSSPASSMKDLQTQVFCFLEGIQRAPGRSGRRADSQSASELDFPAMPQVESSPLLFEGAFKATECWGKPGALCVRTTVQARSR